MLATTATIAKNNAEASTSHTKQIDLLVGKVDDVLQSQATLLSEHQQNTSMVTRLLNSSNSLTERVEGLMRRMEVIEGSQHTTPLVAMGQRAAGTGGCSAPREAPTRTIQVQDQQLNHGDHHPVRSPVACALSEDQQQDIDTRRNQQRFGHAKMPRTDFPRFNGEDPCNTPM